VVEDPNSANGTHIVDAIRRCQKLAPSIRQLGFAPRNTGGEATFFWKNIPGLDTPDLQTWQVEVSAVQRRDKR
jgi:hypothetical protein